MSTTEAEHEQTPLLDHQTQDVYSRFTFQKKQTILLIVSFSSLLTFFAGWAFVPTIAVIARDLKVSQEEINWNVAAYHFTFGIGGLAWGVYSGYYGRRPVYLLALPTYMVASFGVALSQNLWHLSIMRSIQGFGASCFPTTGIAAISDIFKLEERGRAMGVYTSIMLIGPAIAPLMGGAVSRYLSWRWMQVILGIGSFIAFVLVYLWLPETIHPGLAGYEKRDQSEHPRRRRRSFVFLNPLTSLTLLMSPVLLISATVGAIALATDYYLLVPLSHVFKQYYSIDNELVIGAIALPSGIGNMMGALAGGWLSDYYIIKGEQSRGGVWVPEDRLKAVLPGIAIFISLAVLGYSLTTECIRGKQGIFLDLFWLFLNGFGVSSVIEQCNVYAVDIFFIRNAEVSAAASALRHFFASGISGISLSLIKSRGMVQTGTLLAIVCWIVSLMLVVNIKYGKKLRDWKDMGYTLTK